jgi:hypothetical protein
MKTFLSLLKFDDVKESPMIKINLPVPIPIGSRIHLNFSLKRKNGNRTEELKVSGEFKVIEVSFDPKNLKQNVIVVSTTVAPVWKSIKNGPKRKMVPIRSPKTSI